MERQKVDMDNINPPCDFLDHVVVPATSGLLL